MKPRLFDASSIIILIKMRSRVFRHVTEDFRILPLTIFEIGNVFRAEAYLTKTTSPEKAAVMLDGISGIVKKMRTQNLDVDDPVKVLNLAGKCGLTFYDAAYLNAAMVSGYTLVTEDRKLAREASKEGIEVLTAADIQESFSKDR